MIKCIVLCLMLTGCHKTLTQHQIKEAIEICKPDEGIYEVRIYDTNEKYVVCKNSKLVKLAVK